MLYFRKGDYCEQIFDSLIYAANNILTIFILVGITVLTNVIDLNHIYIYIYIYTHFSTIGPTIKPFGLERVNKPPLGLGLEVIWGHYMCQFCQKFTKREILSS